MLLIPKEGASNCHTFMQNYFVLFKGLSGTGIMSGKEFPFKGKLRL